MNEQMTIWVIIVGIFVVALIFRIIERMREETIKDPHFLETADENDIYTKENDDELDDFDDL
ncbi:MAG: hypothetical protein IJ456_03920 [Bacteroides sp.]|nr:hypothetical protein [Bacteroides sp.]